MIAAIVLSIVLHAQVVVPIMGNPQASAGAAAAPPYVPWILKPGTPEVLRPGVPLVLFK